MFGKQPAGRTPLDQRRDERELFFWTAREILKLVVAVYLVVSLVTGNGLVYHWLSYLK